MSVNTCHFSARKSGAMKVQSVRGMNDIFEPSMMLWHRIEETLRRVYGAFGYGEIRTPIVESTSLFSRGVGSDSDIVEKEMYTFLDRNGDSLSLRPEGTASVARAVIEHGLMNENPTLKLYYLGAMFRHERPQKGRYRQFHQYGIELLGVETPQADTEIMSCHHVLYQELKLKDVELRLSSIGCDVCRPKYKALLTAKLIPLESQLPADFQKKIHTNPQRIFDHKDEKIKELASSLPLILDHLCSECQTHFEKVQTGLTNLNVPFTVDPKIVRGIDYYYRTAFEFTSNHLGAQSAVGGGGRYDKLFEELGGKPTPGVGYAGGLERLVMLLEAQDLKLSERVDFFFVCPDEGGFLKAQSICHELRIRSVRADMELQTKSMKAQMKRAGKVNSRFAVIIGSQEVEKGVAVVRNMDTQAQEEISLEKLLAHLMKIKV